VVLPYACITWEEGGGGEGGGLSVISPGSVM